MVKTSVGPRQSTSIDIFNSEAEKTFLTMKNKELAKSLAEVKTRYAEILAERGILQKELFSVNSKNNMYMQKLNSVTSLCENGLKYMVALSHVFTNIMSITTNSIDNNSEALLESDTPNNNSTLNNSSKNKMRVVRPMISGHTISHPTIKLNRITEEMRANTAAVPVEENGEVEETEDQQPSSSTNDPEAFDGIDGIMEHEIIEPEEPEEGVADNEYTRERLDTVVEVTELSENSSTILAPFSNVSSRRPYVQLYRGTRTSLQEDVSPNPDIPAAVEDDPLEGTSRLLDKTERSQGFAEFTQGCSNANTSQTSTPYIAVTVRGSRKSATMSVSLTDNSSLASGLASTPPKTFYVNKKKRSGKSSRHSSPRVYLKRLSSDEIHSSRFQKSADSKKSSPKKPIRRKMSAKKISVKVERQSPASENASFTSKSPNGKAKRTLVKIENNFSPRVRKRAATQGKCFKEPSLRTKLRRS